MPARVGWRTRGRDTERLDRDPDWRARMLADGEALQGATGLADRDARQATSGDMASGCMRDDKPHWHAFARLTPQLSCKGFK